MNNPAPTVEPAGDIWPRAWVNWFSQVAACLPWNKAVSTSATLDFPSVSAQSQQALAVTVKGARAGAAVLVTPASDAAGIVFAGVVTADDTVTVTAKNFTAGSINPAAQAFRIIVFQN